MTTYQVVGATPVNFISENTAGNVGKQYQIPLSALTVTSGQPDATAWLAAAKITNATDKSLVNTLVAALTAQNVLSVITVGP
jgi:hypothetical protein